MQKPIIGMIHLEPLPGAPQFAGDTSHILERAQKDYKALREGGVDGVLLENFGDRPFVKDAVEPQTISWMTRIILSLSIDIPFGINVLRNDTLSALAIAHATGGKFVRCNVLTGVMVTDQGIIEGKASQILRYRHVLKTDIRIFADVSVKHARPLVTQPIEQMAKDTAYRGLADALIVTGLETGEPPEREDLLSVRKAAPDKFVIAGSGVDTENVESILNCADGCIVGKAFKKGGRIENPVDAERVKTFMRKVEQLR